MSQLLRATIYTLGKVVAQVSTFNEIHMSYDPKVDLTFRTGLRRSLNILSDDGGPNNKVESVLTTVRNHTCW